jgi:hypothetical protein
VRLANFVGIASIDEDFHKAYTVTAAGYETTGKMTLS